MLRTIARCALEDGGGHVPVRGQQRETVDQQVEGMRVAAAAAGGRGPRDRPRAGRPHRRGGLR